MKSVQIQSYFWSVFSCAWIYGRFKISVFSTNTGKYGPGKTPCLHTFHVVRVTDFVGMRNYAAIIIIIVRYEFN